LRNIKKKIAIAGHTDTDPVVKTAKKYPYGNIQLSSMRAIAVYDYLKKKGVPERRMSTQGFGPNDPLVENTSAENKRRNRRVEIIILD
jgi:flagellar motor protein MotB